MEVKRTILAVALSMVVLLVFQKYMAPPPPAPKQETAAPDAVPGSPEAQRAGGAAAPRVESVDLDPVRGETVAQQDLPVVETQLTNDVLTVDLSSRGGSVMGARLRQYREGREPDASEVELLVSPSGLDLLGATGLAQTDLPWSRVYEQVEADPTRVVYDATGQDGVTIRKTYTLEPGHYDLGLEVRVINGGNASLRDRLRTVMIQDFSNREDKYTFAGPAYFQGEEYEEIDIDDLEDEEVRVSGDIWWAAFVEKYFLTALVPEEPEGKELQVSNHLGTAKVVELAMYGSAFDLAPGEETILNYRVYLGPKKGAVLEPLGSRLDHLIDYGFTNVIAQPLLWFLNWIYGFIGNYGVAIVILTTVIKLVFWPLSAKSYKSMQRMKELQPKMQRLKERYAEDKERLNREVMQLYKTHKVNPLGGCLPMLVQIPFFLALYRILLGSIELRHAPFMWWIQDLSAPDTLFSDLVGLPFAVGPLPIMMGATMFLQQRMTPVSGGNETQMKMMMYGMPLIFTFLFMGFPSGLVIYWLVNNVLSIAQQGWQLKQSKAANPAPA